MAKLSHVVNFIVYNYHNYCCPQALAAYSIIILYTVDWDIKIFRL